MDKHIELNLIEFAVITGVDVPGLVEHRSLPRIHHLYLEIFVFGICRMI